MKIGKITGNALKRSVLKPITYQRKEVVNGAGLGADCAIFRTAAGACSASCVQTAEVTGAAEVSLSIVRCVNSLVSAGAVPFATMLGFVYPEYVEEQVIKKYQQIAHETCKKHGMQIAGGHTTVSRAVSVPILTVSAYGAFEKEVPGQSIAAGQEVVLTKWIGLEGSGLIAGEQREKLLGRFPYSLVEEACSFLEYCSVEQEAAFAWDNRDTYGVTAMHDVSEGGILAALWELTEDAGNGQPMGLTVDLKKIPIRQETVEICEYEGLNPYQLRSVGALLIAAKDGAGLAEALCEAGVYASVIGRLTDSKDRVIVNEDEIRYLDRPAVDDWYNYSK